MFGGEKKMNKKSLAITLTVIIIIIIIVGSYYLFLKPKEKPSIVLKIGYQPSTHHIAHILAMEKGWWKEKIGISFLALYQIPRNFPQFPPTDILK